MKTNKKPANTLTTHEGGKAVPESPELELRRAVSSCLLWENTFYEKGSDLATRIADLCDQVDNEKIAKLASAARHDLRLRHVPLWLAIQLVRKKAGRIARETISWVVQRPDEMTELLSLYWKDGKKHVTRQMRMGLSDAFVRFSPYQLKKWDRDGSVRLRDVLFICHAKPQTDEQALTWKQLIDGTLPAAETWEEKLSAGGDKKAVFTELLTEKKLGYMALLMNLRNMEQAGVDRHLIREALLMGAGNSKALPFRFVAAAKHAPHLADALSQAMVNAMSGLPGLPGRTIFLVDVSGSMTCGLSDRGETSRMEAAGALAVLLRGVCEEVEVFTFSHNLVAVPSHIGLPLITAIVNSQGHGGTYLRSALEGLSSRKADRCIVLTDEQSHDGMYPAWCPKSYLINVASYKPGLDVSHGWKRINGFSERIVEWIRLEESNEPTPH